jgi:hypothetical protein
MMKIMSYIPDDTGTDDSGIHIQEIIEIAAEMAEMEENNLMLWLSN